MANWKCGNGNRMPAMYRSMSECIRRHLQVETSGNRPGRRRRRSPGLRDGPPSEYSGRTGTYLQCPHRRTEEWSCPRSSDPRATAAEAILDQALAPTSSGLHDLPSPPENYRPASGVAPDPTGFPDFPDQAPSIARSTPTPYRSVEARSANAPCRSAPARNRGEARSLGHMIPGSLGIDQASEEPFPDCCAYWHPSAPIAGTDGCRPALLRTASDS